LRPTDAGELRPNPSGSGLRSDSLTRHGQTWVDAGEVRGNAGKTGDREQLSWPLRAQSGGMRLPAGFHAVARPTETVRTVKPRQVKNVRRHWNRPGNLVGVGHDIRLTYGQRQPGPPGIGHGGHSDIRYLAPLVESARRFGLVNYVYLGDRLIARHDPKMLARLRRTEISRRRACQPIAQL
jgi:hypothetical protein